MVSAVGMFANHYQQTTNKNASKGLLLNKFRYVLVLRFLTLSFDWFVRVKTVPKQRFFFSLQEQV